MKVRFTKMQGAGNDFVVLDATRAPLDLTTAQLRRLGDRRLGVGADQILLVEASAAPGVDFRYRIFNGASGDEVEQCGNGARCFVRYVYDKGLSAKRTLCVETMSTRLELMLQDDGRVTVDMSLPGFDPARVPFDNAGLVPRRVNGFSLWPLEVAGRVVEAAVLSMGNPHAAIDVAQFGVTDVDDAPVAEIGPLVERHPRFPRRVNAGFMQVVDRAHIRLRVHERDAGETLACGTGACAAVVAGIRLGRLDRRVDVATRGGRLTIEWPLLPGGALPRRSGLPATGFDSNDSTDAAGVLMTGPAETVFEGEIEL